MLLCKVRDLVSVGAVPIHDSKDQPVLPRNHAEVVLVGRVGLLSPLAMDAEHVRQVAEALEVVNVDGLVAEVGLVNILLSRPPPDRADCSGRVQLLGWVGDHVEGVTRLRIHLASFDRLLLQVQHLVDLHLDRHLAAIAEAASSHAHARVRLGLETKVVSVHGEVAHSAGRSQTTRTTQRADARADIAPQRCQRLTDGAQPRLRQQLQLVRQLQRGEIRCLRAVGGRRPYPRRRVAGRHLAAPGGAAHRGLAAPRPPGLTDSRCTARCRADRAGATQHGAAGPAQHAATRLAAWRC
mmetsp:Transcript_71046/g.183208  ORF Transcript_71046/g.183208 Transcript_71046/m.183208 type:complete len:296 (+) Transcript_71046:794-1681(+)